MRVRPLSSAAPLLQRFDRLYVVMAVEKQCRFSRRAEPLTVDERVAFSFDQTDVADPGKAQTLSDPFRAVPHVSAVFRVGTDTRDFQKLLQLGDVPLLRVGHDSIVN
jgi:hypothetical protein